MAEAIVAQTLKRCARCKTERPADRDNFSPLKKAKDGLHSWCKPCLAEWRREDRARKPEHYSEIGRRAWVNNRDKRSASAKRYYAANRDAQLERMRNRADERRDQYNANRRARRASDPAYAERVRQGQRATAEKHGHKYAEQRRQAWKVAPPQRRLRTYFTAAICHSLKGSTKGGRSWQAILGYTTEDLRKHLERQFTKGMSWENYGEWHVDHIVPVASFTFESADDADFAACWALTNLRPMWARENIRKRDKRLTLL